MDRDDADDVQHGVLLGRWVRARREELGLTQEELAERVGVDPNWFSRLEHGRFRRMVPQPRLSILAAGLAVSEEELLRACGVLPDAGRTEEELEARAVVRPNLRRLAEILRGVTDEDAADLVPVVRGILRVANRANPDRFPVPSHDPRARRTDFALAG